MNIERNHSDKKSKALERLLSTLTWKDAFRALYPQDLIFSREFSSAVHGHGASRIDRAYKYGEVKIIEASYVAVPFSDHMSHIIKFELPYSSFC